MFVLPSRRAPASERRRTAEVWIGSSRIGVVGQVHPRVATAFDIKNEVAMFELDLEDTEPTSHVVDLENVLRPDEPRPSWPRERMLEEAPDASEGAFRVPSPQA